MVPALQASLFGLFLMGVAASLLGWDLITASSLLVIGLCLVTGLLQPSTRARAH